MKGLMLTFGALGLISIAMVFLSEQLSVRIIFVALLAVCVGAILWMGRKSRAQ